MQSSEQVNNIAPNYSPEVDTEKPFTRKRKENDLDGKVLYVFWWDRHCRVAQVQLIDIGKIFSYINTYLMLSGGGNFLT